MYHFIGSFVCILALFSDDSRFQSGGYNPHFNKMQIFFGAFGFAFGTIGLLGVYDDKPNWIRIYNYYQFAKLAVLAFVFVADQYTLQSCDGWVSNINSHINYNPTLESISLLGLCKWVRTCYTIGFAFDFALNFYWANVSYDYCSKLEMNPPYLISFGKDKQGLQHLDAVATDSRDWGEPGAFLDNSLQTPSQEYGEGYACDTLGAIREQERMGAGRKNLLYGSV